MNYETIAQTAFDLYNAAQKAATLKERVAQYAAAIDTLDADDAAFRESMLDLLEPAAFELAAAEEQVAMLKKQLI